MFTVEDFLSQYQTYTDEQLIDIRSNADNYNPEAAKAVDILIDKRGGLEAARQRVRQKQETDAEISRINAEAMALTEAEDRKIKPRTIYGSLLGGILASLIGSALWGGQLILAGGYIELKITVLLFTGLSIVCYGIIKAATKQSRKNAMVLITTVLSVLISLGIGQLLFDITR